MKGKYRYKKPYRIKKKKSIIRNKFFWLIIFVLVVLGVIFYLVVFASFFQIKEIQITGNQKIPAEEIKAVIAGQISHRLVFFNSKSIFLLKPEEIRQKILGNFSQIAETNIKRRLPDIFKIEIKEKIPVASWYQSSLAERQNEDCFYIDKEGVIFERNPEKLQPIIRPESPILDLVLGKPVIERKYLEAILEIDGQLKKNLGIDVKEFIFSANEEKLTVETSQGWKIIFNLEKGVTSQIFNLEVVLKEKIPLETRGNLEYIDLRFGNRVYFKYR